MDTCVPNSPASDAHADGRPERGGQDGPIAVISPPRLGNELGFQYYKLTIERADAAWEKLHTITRWNYAAFAAASALIGTDKIGSNAIEVEAPAICGFIVVSSLVAAALALMQTHYALWVYGYAWSAEKSWLGNRRSGAMIERAREHRQRPGPERGESIAFRQDSLTQAFTNVHVFINLVPAVIAVVVLVLVLSA